MDQFLNVTDAGTNNPSDMDVMSWFIIILLTCAPFVVFGCVSCTIFCIDCNENGEVVVLKFGCGARKRMIQKSIVTKTVLEHSDLNPVICERTARSRDRHATSNRSAVSTKPDYSDSDCSDQRCAICLDTFEIGESVSWAKTTMYCNHAFHTSCIKHWLHRKRTCPVCRYGIILRQDQYVRCNTWSDWCCGRRPRVLYYKQHRGLMVQCRESGQYCVGHGLVFPYESPRLNIPYEPRVREMKHMLSIVKSTKTFKSNAHFEKVKNNKMNGRKKQKRGEILIRRISSSYEDEVLRQLSVESETVHNESNVVYENEMNISQTTNDIEANTMQGSNNDPVLHSPTSNTGIPGTSSFLPPTMGNDDSAHSEDEPRVVALVEDEGTDDDLVVHSGRRGFRLSRLRNGIRSEVMDRSTSVDNNIRRDDDTV